MGKRRYGNTHTYRQNTWINVHLYQWIWKFVLAVAPGARIEIVLSPIDVTSHICSLMFAVVVAITRFNKTLLQGKDALSLLRWGTEEPTIARLLAYTCLVPKVLSSVCRFGKLANTSRKSFFQGYLKNIIRHQIDRIRNHVPVCTNHDRLNNMIFVRSVKSSGYSVGNVRAIPWLDICAPHAGVQLRTNTNILKTMLHVGHYVHDWDVSNWSAQASFHTLSRVGNWT